MPNVVECNRQAIVVCLLLTTRLSIGVSWCTCLFQLLYDPLW